jgi:dihydroorotate dehydrogenase (NAD+) catalytic subunit
MGTYRIDRTYAWNYEHGPDWQGPFPRVPRTQAKEVLGLSVNSRIGVSAGLLLNSRWIECYSRLGFDLLTYKTVRTRARRSYPLPNWVFLDGPRDLDPARDEVLRVRSRAPRAVPAAGVSSAVCFGMPSMEPEIWRADIERARKGLRRGQVLIVSVVGSPSDAGSADELIEDFARCARWAAEAGAGIVEANYSCPNVCTREGTVYQDEVLTRRLSAALRAALPSTPLAVKIGHVPPGESLDRLFRALDGNADAIVLVNGMTRRVVDAAGAPVFGAHERVGVLGRAIHAPALELVRAAVVRARQEKRQPSIFAVGGAGGVAEAADFFDAGASAVLLGSSPMLDPLLAVTMKRAHPEW